MTQVPWTTLLLRNPHDLVDVVDDPDHFSVAVTRLVATAAIGVALFGAAVGAYRGGIQVAFAAVKLPLLLGLPLIAGLPLVHAMGGGALSWRRLVAASLVGSARSALVLAALAPILWLGFTWTLPDHHGAEHHVLAYHDAVLLFVGMLGIGGLPLLAGIARALPARGASRLAWMSASTLSLGVLLMQSGWLLRPFVVRPTAEIALLRPIEEDVFSALWWTSSSALGIYDSDGWDAEASGMGRWGGTR